MISHSRPHRSSSTDKPTSPPVLKVRSRVRGWTVAQAIEEDAPNGTRSYLARDEAGAYVVLRVPPDSETAARMRIENDLAQCHLHQSIVQVVGMVEHEGWPVQVVEYVDGINLETLTLLNGPLPTAAACRVGWQIALALGELHGRQPVAHHGALSTSRIIVDAHGNARLRDLGRVASQQAPSRMSPERRDSTMPRPSAGDDIFALGLIVAEAALGQPLELNGGPFNTKIIGNRLPDRLVDALFVLLAPAESRVRNVSAAVRIFVDLEAQVGGGGDRALRTVLQSARLGLAFGGINEQTEDGNHEPNAAPAPADEDDGGINTLPDSVATAKIIAAVTNANSLDAEPDPFAPTDIAALPVDRIASQDPSLPPPPSEGAIAAVDPHAHTPAPKHTQPMPQAEAQPVPATGAITALSVGIAPGSAPGLTFFSVTSLFGSPTPALALGTMM